MPKVHVYVRTQVTADDVSGIESAVEALRAAIVAVDGDVRGFSATVEPDEPVETETTEPADTEPASVLDGTVADVSAGVASMTDLAALKALRSQETKGKNRTGALDAIDARIAAVKEQG